MLKGKITRIIYQTNDFVIAKLRDENENQEVIILGNIYGLNKGDYIQIYEAKEEYHKDFGKQYRVLRWEKPIPVTRESVIEFLCLIKYIGPVRARNIVDALGNDALKRIMDEGPEILRPIPAIGKRADQIYFSVLEQFELQLLVQELSPLGLSLKNIMNIYKELGPKGAKLIKNDPYTLVYNNITSFSKADLIALNNGEEKDSPKRIFASFKAALADALKLGHCYLPKEKLILDSTKILNTKIDRELINQELLKAINSGSLKSEGERIYLPVCFYAESEVAYNIAQLSKIKSFPRNVDSIIAQYEKDNNIILASKQKEAIKTLFSSNLMVLTGGPGTGKTETIKAIVNIYKSVFPNHKIAQAAPTGRASRRLSEITQKEAKTIHRLLAYQPAIGPQYNEKKPLPYNLIVIDEFSMVDIFLARDLFKAINLNTKVLIVGDKDQLPPVGAGNIFKDLLSADIPIVELTEVFRQAQESQIVSNAHSVNQGKGIKINPNKTDFYYLETNKAEQILSLTEKSVLRLLEKGYDIDEVQVLVPTRKDLVGVYNLNDILQKATNPIAPNEIKYGKKLFKVGDKVMQVENNYEKDVFNGDIGTIVDIAPIYEDGEEVEREAVYVNYGDRLVIYRTIELDQIELAYATTIHKSQGGEYRAVILVLGPEHYMMGTRNLLYTGMTRAKEFLCIIGSKKVLIKAIKNNEVSQRNTGLVEKIQRNLQDAIPKGV